MCVIIIDVALVRSPSPLVPRVAIHNNHTTQATTSYSRTLTNLFLLQCDSTYPCVASDLPAGCLRIYPYTYSQTICKAAEGAMGSCGNVEMQKCEDKQGSKIEKRVCESVSTSNPWPTSG